MIICSHLSHLSLPPSSSFGRALEISHVRLNMAELFSVRHRTDMVRCMGTSQRQDIEDQESHWYCWKSVQVLVLGANYIVVSIESKPNKILLQITIS